jgi:cytoskeletal protein RodZ
MNLVKRTGIVLLVLVFFFSAWMAYHLLEQPKTQEISSVSPTDSIVPSQDTVETNPNEQEKPASSIKKIH